MGNGKSGFNCENNLCAYWTWFNRNKIKCGFPDKIIIGCNGCKSFKPGVYYYINETWKTWAIVILFHLIIFLILKT